MNNATDNQFKPEELKTLLDKAFSSTDSKEVEESPKEAKEKFKKQKLSLTSWNILIDKFRRLCSLGFIQCTTECKDILHKEPISLYAQSNAKLYSLFNLKQKNFNVTQVIDEENNLDYAKFIIDDNVQKFPQVRLDQEQSASLELDVVNYEFIENFILYYIQNTESYKDVIFQKNRKHCYLDDKALEGLKVLFEDVIPTQELDGISGPIFIDGLLKERHVSIIRLLGLNIRNTLDTQISEQEKLQRLDTLGTVNKDYILLQPWQ